MEFHFMVNWIGNHGFPSCSPGKVLIAASWLPEWNIVRYCQRGGGILGRSINKVNNYYPINKAEDDSETSQPQGNTTSINCPT